MKGKTTRPFIRLAIGYILAVTLFLPARSAVAASEQAAQVVKDSYCFEYEGSTICYDNIAVVTEVTTPSGITSFVGTGWSSYSQTDHSGVVVYQDSLKYHTQGLMMDSVLYEFGQFFTYSVDMGGGTCMINYAFHVVDDEIQFERSTTCG